MRTQKQIDASRANGAKSNGPRAEEGKAKSSKNATKHALTAADHDVLYMNDNFPHFTEHLESYLHWLNPVGKLERDLVVQIASGVWRLKRVDCLEAALVDSQMDRTREEFEAEFEQWDSGVRQADAVEKLANNGNGLSLMIRYRTASARTLARILADLRILQRDRLRDEKEGLRPSRDATAPLPSTNSGWTSTYQQHSFHEESWEHAPAQHGSSLHVVPAPTEYRRTSMAYAADLPEKGTPSCIGVSTVDSAGPARQTPELVSPVTPVIPLESLSAPVLDEVSSEHCSLPDQRATSAVTPGPEEPWLQNEPKVVSPTLVSSLQQFSGAERPYATIQGSSNPPSNTADVRPLTVSLSDVPRTPATAPETQGSRLQNEPKVLSPTLASSLQQFSGAERPYATIQGASIPPSNTADVRPLTAQPSDLPSAPATAPETQGSRLQNEPKVVSPTLVSSLQQSSGAERPYAPIEGASAQPPISADLIPFTAHPSDVPPATAPETQGSRLQNQPKVVSPTLVSSRQQSSGAEYPYAPIQGASAQPFISADVRPLKAHPFDVPPAPATSPETQGSRPQNEPEPPIQPSSSAEPLPCSDPQAKAKVAPSAQPSHSSSPRTFYIAILRNEPESGSPDDEEPSPDPAATTATPGSPAEPREPRQ